MKNTYKTNELPLLPMIFLNLSIAYIGYFMTTIVSSNSLIALGLSLSIVFGIEGLKEILTLINLHFSSKIQSIVTFVVLVGSFLTQDFSVMLFALPMSILSSLLCGGVFYTYYEKDPDSRSIYYKKDVSKSNIKNENISDLEKEINRVIQTVDNLAPNPAFKGLSRNIERLRDIALIDEKTFISLSQELNYDIPNIEDLANNLLTLDKSHNTIEVIEKKNEIIRLLYSYNKKFEKKFEEVIESLVYEKAYVALELKELIKTQKGDAFHENK